MDASDKIDSLLANGLTLEALDLIKETRADVEEWAMPIIFSLLDQWGTDEASEIADMISELRSS